MVGWLSIQDWTGKKNKRKKNRKKEKGAVCGFLCFILGGGSRSHGRVWGVLTPWLGEEPWVS